MNLKQYVNMISSKNYQPPNTSQMGVGLRKNPITPQEIRKARKIREEQE